MGNLLSGQAPLRGRASLELLIRPFSYLDAAEFWGITDPKLAILLHAVVGGTPAYRREFVRYDAPTSVTDFNDWIVRTVLNPQSPLFREARYLLAEETDICEPGLYHTVLAAIAEGNRTWGGIASYVGRKSPEISHPLHVLKDAGLVVKEPDVFRSGRAQYRIIEPLITFYQAVMRPEWTRLNLNEATEVWSQQRAVFLAQIMGPHFESLCRDFTLRRGNVLFGEPVSEIGAGVVSDLETRSATEVDVVAFATAQPGKPQRVLSLGEAKWGKTMGPGHVARLARARDLLAAKGYDTTNTTLTCYSGSGFHSDTPTTVDKIPVKLIDLKQMYAK